MGLGRVQHRRRSLLIALLAGGLLTLAFASTAGAANGRWDRLWGKGVAGGGLGGPEICTIASACNDGQPGSLGGEFSAPRAVASDDGFVYVGHQNRIDKFSFNGNFVLAWGKDVVQGGTTGLEVCRAADGDLCKTGVIDSGEKGFADPWSIATRTNVFGSEDVFLSDAGNDRVERWSENGELELAWGKDVIASGTGNTAGGGFEICDPGVAVCQGGASTGASDRDGGEFVGVGSLDYAANHVYVGDAHRIQSFNATTGAFERAWGKDVIEGNAETGAEICEVASQCKQGEIGDGAGELSAPRAIGTGPDGSVFVGEFNNQRISKFTGSGGFIRAWGKNVVASGAGNVDNSSFEICHPTVLTMDVCQTGTAGADAGEIQKVEDVTTDDDRNVYLSADNKISKYTETGTFLRAWGGDVVDSGPDDTVAGDEEICLPGADVCKEGDTANFAGGTFNGGADLAVNGVGDLFIADYGWDRVQKFSDTIPPAGSISTTTPGQPNGPTGQQAAAIKKCKKIKKKKKRKKCLKKAQQLPV